MEQASKARQAPTRAGRIPESGPPASFHAHQTDGLVRRKPQPLGPREFLTDKHRPTAVPANPVGNRFTPIKAPGK
jgi:hypothetical protein